MSAQSEGPECQQKIGMPCGHITASEPTPNYNLVFHNKDGDEIGRLDFNGPGLSFEGIADLSAITFMDHVNRVFKSRLDAEYQRGYKEGKKQNEAND